MEAAAFDRTLDVGWRRSSYSSITRALHEQPNVGSEPEQQLTSDEDGPAVPVPVVGSLEVPRLRAPPESAVVVEGEAAMAEGVAAESYWCRALQPALALPVGPTALR